MDTSSSKTARQHTQLVPRRTGSKPTAQIHYCQRPVASKFTRPEPLGLPCLGQCWRPITSAIRNRKRSPNWRWSMTAYTSGTMTKLSKSSQSDSRPVLQLRVDISNIHSNCNVVTLLLMFEWCYFTSWLLGHFWACENRYVTTLYNADNFRTL